MPCGGFTSGFDRGFVIDQIQTMTIDPTVVVINPFDAEIRIRPWPCVSYDLRYVKPTCTVPGTYTKPVCDVDGSYVAPSALAGEYIKPAAASGYYFKPICTTSGNYIKVACDTSGAFVKVAPFSGTFNKPSAISGHYLKTASSTEGTYAKPAGATGLACRKFPCSSSGVRYVKPPSHRCTPLPVWLR